MTIHVTLTGTSNTLADLAAFPDLMTMDPRSPCICEDGIVEFDPDVSTTLTLDNTSLMFMDTAQLIMHPSSASVVHKIVFNNVSEAAFSGGAGRDIVTATHSGTSATFTIALPSGIVNHNLTTADKVVISGVGTDIDTAAQIPEFAAYNSVPGTPWQITAVSAPGASPATITATLASVPGADYVFGTPAKFATQGALTSNTYANGTAGVGATLTSTANVVLVVDNKGPTSNPPLLVGDRVLVKNESSGLKNGMYTVTSVGSTTTPWVMTRTTDFDTSAEMPTGLAFPITAGARNANTVWYLSNTSAITVGTTALTFLQRSENPTLTADTPTFNDKGLWFMDAAVCDMVGTTKKAWTRAAGDIPQNLATGTGVLCVDDVSDWSVGDEVAIVPTDLTWTDYDTLTVASVSGNTVFFSAQTTFAHPAFLDQRNNVTYGAELLNLTRNVRVEGQDATHRAHMMIHNTSPVVQTLAYASFRYLGPRQNLDVVVGRWPVHLHKEGVKSVGSTFTGMVVRNAGSHAFVTQHASNGVTMTDCIAHDVATHAYWWDLLATDAPDGAVWDRCVASKVGDGGTQIDANRMGGFLLGSTVTDLGSTMKDCVAVGVAAAANAHETSGFEWVFFGGATIGASTPMVRGWNTPPDHPNVSHNNKEYGIFIWCNENNSRGTHNLHDFVIYRNGTGGYTNGAYSEVFCHRRAVVADNGYSAVDLDHRCVSLEANSDVDSLGGTRWQVHNDGYFDASNRSSCIRVGSPLLLHDGPRVQVLDCKFKNAKDGKVILVQQSASTSQVKPSIIDFVRCAVYDVGSSTPRDLLTTDFTYELFKPHPPDTGVQAGLTHRVQSRDDLSAYQIFFPTIDLASKVVTVIPPFALAVQTGAVIDGTVGVSYTQLLATNGKEQGAVTWALKHGSAALPPGLNISSGGVISGTPTLDTGTYPRTYPFTVEVTDERGVTAPKDYVSTVNSGAVLHITSSNPPPGFVGVPYDFPLTAADGTPPYVFTKDSGTMPPGLGASGGVSIHGTPTQVGTFNMVLRVTDAVAATATRSITFVMTTLTPFISNTDLADAEVGVPYHDTLHATGGTPPYTYSVIGGVLPAGIFLAPTGELTGTPTMVDQELVTFRVTESNATTGSADLTFIIFPAVAEDPTPLPSGRVGEFYSAQCGVVGGQGPYLFEAPGLPTGLQISTTGLIFGTPLLADLTFTFVLIVTDNLGGTFNQDRVLPILPSVIIPPPPPGVWVPVEEGDTEWEDIEEGTDVWA